MEDLFNDGKVKRWSRVMPWVLLAITGIALVAVTLNTCQSRSQPQDSETTETPIE